MLLEGGCMQEWICQCYKAIKATGGWYRARILKATRISRLQEGNAEMGFSRLQDYQGYMRVAQGEALFSIFSFYLLTH